MLKVRLASFLASDHGTFGRLDVGGFAFFTCEDDHWAVPAGVYRLQRTVYHRGDGALTYEITGIPGHSRVLFHWGNTEEDTEGCVLLGMTLGFLEVNRDEETDRRATKLAVFSSRRAFEKFMLAMGNAKEAELEVVRQESRLAA